MSEPKYQEAYMKGEPMHLNPAIIRELLGEGEPVHIVFTARPYFPPETSPPYKISTFQFLDERERRECQDGCLFVFPAKQDPESPRTSSRAMRITDQKIVFRRAVIRGGGWLLYIDKDGKVQEQRLEKGSMLPELSAGMIDCMIAGTDGMVIVDISTPPFSTEKEEEIKRDTPNIPPKFWERYNILKGSSPWLN